MPIPESQLETWSHQGSVTQSSSTYSTVKKSLEVAGTPYAAKITAVFLQGSYCNDTNVFAESDVDVVIRLDDCFQHDLKALPDDDKAAFKAAHSDATYTHREFKRDVLATLVSAFGAFVTSGPKAIAIEANGNRRDADVIAAIKFRRYHRFKNLGDQKYDEGIWFAQASGDGIANYPKQHSANLTAKHQRTNSWFKPTARILKNLRGKLVDDGVLAAKVAPSYFLEGLLYNVPDDKFCTSYGTCIANALNWIASADKTTFVCANEQYYLLRDGYPVTWRTELCDEFLAAAVDLWNQW